MSAPNAKLSLLADRMATSLGEGVIALAGVKDALTALLDAIRSSQFDRLAAAADNLQDYVHVAAERQVAHRRQLELFFRVASIEGDSIDDALLILHRVPEAAEAAANLSAARQATRDIARDSGQLVAAAEFALRSAGGVNHELIIMLHGLMQPQVGTVYTARGTTNTPRNHRRMLDRRG
ncbi:MAG: hypothetical protein JJ896_12570 [Rhodothermales bacterium]|nr:hypothetical protein [Rhodothermales bacterium]MBO6780480.1 hypothetical protein [Rhodothermales bacterium]